MIEKYCKICMRNDQNHFQKQKHKEKSLKFLSSLKKEFKKIKSNVDQIKEREGKGNKREDQFLCIFCDEKVIEIKKEKFEL